MTWRTVFSNGGKADEMMRTIAIAGVGEMGVALARRMIAQGQHVVTFPPRSAASVERARQAGIEIVAEDEIGGADFFFSVVPSEAAAPLAERVASICRSHARKPVYCEWNAISPGKLQCIADRLAAAGMTLIDGGIIGLANWSVDTPGPTLYASGPAAGLLAEVGDLGLQITVMDAGLGAASALKLSYAAITKGLIAIATMAAIAAQRKQCDESLTAELARSQSGLLDSFSKSVPNMLPKAQRWTSEMAEISDYLGADSQAGMIYAAIAKVFGQIATSVDTRDFLACAYRVRPEGQCCANALRG
ncbi:DUF1932 domain-containing protein [Labrys okinawensis]|uniref:NAD(P)-dependent oxidoreductase n=1 Tax=Labrys okinawensis TaxID=346911 RepID=UPI0039BC7A6F